MAEVYAGTIGGVNYNEYAGSVSISVTESGIVARRRITIDWSDIWTLYAALIARPINKTPKTDLYDFPTWPGKYATSDIIPNSEKYKTRLVVSDFSYEPSFAGRQPGISADESNSGIASYDKADVILTYTTYTEPKRRSSFITRTSAVRVGSGYVFDDSGKEANGDQTSAIKNIPEQEIITPIWSEEIDENIPEQLSAADLAWAINAVGNSNSDKVSFWLGDNRMQFPTKTLMLASFEVNPVTRFGRQSKEIVYRFIIAPAYLYIVDGPLYGTETTTFPLNNNQNDAWQYSFSEEDNTFVKMSKSPIDSVPFAPLFPWSM